MPSLGEACAEGAKAAGGFQLGGRRGAAKVTGAAIKLSGMRRKSFVSRFCVKDAKPLGPCLRRGYLGKCERGSSDIDIFPGGSASGRQQQRHDPFEMRLDRWPFQDVDPEKMKDGEGQHTTEKEVE